MMILIQDKFKNRNPGIALKTVKGFNIKRYPFWILILQNGSIMRIYIVYIVD